MRSLVVYHLLSRPQTMVRLEMMQVTTTRTVTSFVPGSYQSGRSRLHELPTIRHDPMHISSLYQIAPITSLVASSFSALTANSSVTPAPDWNVIRQRARTFPPPPETIPERLRVWTVFDVGDSVPPRASMFSTVVVSSVNNETNPHTLDQRLARIPQAF
jgi:hypothetical protein